MASRSPVTKCPHTPLYKKVHPLRSAVSAQTTQSADPELISHTKYQTTPEKPTILSPKM